MELMFLPNPFMPSAIPFLEQYSETVIQSRGGLSPVQPPLSNCAPAIYEY
jgi:hypothetical protein